MIECVQHIQESLNTSPSIKLFIHPKMSAGDLRMLRIGNFASRIVELARRNSSPQGPAGGTTLVREKFSETPPPQEEAALIKELVEVTPVLLPQADALAEGTSDHRGGETYRCFRYSSDRLTIADYRTYPAKGMRAGWSWRLQVLL